MLDIKFITENKDEVIRRLNTRNNDYTDDINEVVSLYERYKEALVEAENNKALLNSKSKLIGEYKREKKDTTILLEEIEKLKQGDYANKVKELNEQIINILLTIPNLPHPSVPIGKSEDDNVVLKNVGEIPEFEFKPKAHYEFEGLEFDKAAKISKSRFVITSGTIAKLERAIMNLMLDTHAKYDYIEYGLPQIVNEQTLYNSGQLPKFGDDLFKISSTNNSDDEFKDQTRDFYLIPTAEVVLANLHQGEIINEDELPYKYMAYTQCFRKEAGSAGRDTRGIIRVHEFGKVELFKYSVPEEGYNELELMVEDAARILDILGLPYRVVSLCTADLSAGNAKTYDLEVWFPSQNKYRECSSCSNTDDFQARRTSVRFKRDKQNVLPHLLNGSGMATGRILAAVIENYQNEDGTITIPEALEGYFNA